MGRFKPRYDLERSCDMNTAIQLLDNNRVGGYLMTWRGAANPDLHKQYFTPQTRLNLILPLPICIHEIPEKMDDGAVICIGSIDAALPDTVGLYIEGMLYTHSADPKIAERAKEALKLLSRVPLGWASSSRKDKVRVAEDGEILMWPVFEAMMTATPAEV